MMSSIARQVAIHTTTLTSDRANERRKAERRGGAAAACWTLQIGQAQANTGSCSGRRVMSAPCRSSMCARETERICLDLTSRKQGSTSGVGLPTQKDETAEQVEIVGGSSYHFGLSSGFCLRECFLLVGEAAGVPVGATIFWCLLGTLKQAAAGVVNGVDLCRKMTLASVGRHDGKAAFRALLLSGSQLRTPSSDSCSRC